MKRIFPTLTSTNARTSIALICLFVGFILWGVSTINSNYSSIWAQHKAGLTINAIGWVVWFLFEKHRTLAIGLIIGSAIAMITPTLDRAAFGLSGLALLYIGMRLAVQPAK